MVMVMKMMIMMMMMMLMTIPTLTIKREIFAGFSAFLDKKLRLSTPINIILAHTSHQKEYIKSSVQLFPRILVTKLKAVRFSLVLLFG